MKLQTKFQFKVVCVPFFPHISSEAPQIQVVLKGSVFKLKCHNLTRCFLSRLYWIRAVWSFSGTDNLAALLIPICWLSVRTGWRDSRLTESARALQANKRNVRATDHESNHVQPLRLFFWRARAACVHASLPAVCAHRWLCAIIPSSQQRQECAVELAPSAAPPSITLTGVRVPWTQHRRPLPIQVWVWADVNCSL